MNGYSRGALAALGAVSLVFVVIGAGVAMRAATLGERIAGGAGCAFFGLCLVTFAWGVIWPKAFNARIESNYAPRPARRRKTARPAAFPYPLITVPGEEALAAWERLLAEGRGMPVILGGDEDLAAHLEQLSIKGRKAEDSLLKAQSLPPDAFRAAWDTSDPDPEAVLPDKPWPKAVAAGPPFGTFEPAMKGAVRPRVHIALLPTHDPVAAPAFLAFGGVNGSPLPAQHVAFLRPLAERYGAVVVSCTADALELRVERGPATRGEALALARLFHGYSTWDVASYGEIAAELMTLRRWGFWWD
ncbi:MAG: hypothetical protein JWP35_3575 [Caulobacter sp.]|nr:hypothetical protein [Caulobacter sp.]